MLKLAIYLGGAHSEKKICLFVSDNVAHDLAKSNAGVAKEWMKKREK